MTITPVSSVDIVAPSSGNALHVFSSLAAFESAQRMAKVLCASTLVPTQYRGQENLPNCVVALEISARLGVSAFVVMQNLHIIQGRPSWSSAYLIASVNASGRFSPLRFVLDDNSNPTECYAVATDKQSGQELIGETITMKMAADEGWLSKNGSKWKTMKGQMLRYRAASFWVRIYCPEISLGLKTSEEYEDVEVTDITQSRRSLPQSIASPEIKSVSTQTPVLTVEQLDAVSRAMGQVLSEVGQQAFTVDICNSYEVSGLEKIPATEHSKIMQQLGKPSNQQTWNQGTSLSGEQIVEPGEAEIEPTAEASEAPPSPQVAQPTQAELIPAQQSARRQDPLVRRNPTVEDEL